MITKNSKLWAKNLWKNASSEWMSREQDDNYRKYLVHPMLEDELSEISIENGVLMDIGCGEGKETLFLMKLLKQKGFRDFYGFDINKDFISSAKSLSEEVSFGSGDLGNFLKKYNLKNNVNLVTSLFVLQETPNINDIIKNAHESLKSGGSFLSVIVHPQFAENLTKRNEIKINNWLDKSTEKDYEFAGEYPITEPERPPFYLPYFHRKLSDYIQKLEPKFHIKSVRGLQPSKKLLKISKEQKIAPFYKEKYNVYWEDVAKIPSSIIINGLKNENSV